MALQPGTRLGPYEIVAPLGVGGMGEVYRARDTRLHRDVAIKILPSASAADEDRQARFEQEARAAAALNHPNIVAVFHVGTDDGLGGPGLPSTYIVSELLEGATLAERLRDGALSIRTALDYGIQVTHGLAAAHDRNIVHRDLKPANIFITTDGRAKILDFGLAKLTQPVTALPTDSIVPTTPPGTTPGMAFGTVGYMAPEQVRGQAVDHRADIFAFGVVLYEMVSGSSAFARDTAAETLTAILREDVSDAPLVAHRSPHALSRIIHRCLEKNPAARFQSALDLAFALEATQGSGSGEVVQAAPARRRVGREAIAWTLAGLAAAAAIALAVLWPRAVEPGSAPPMRFQLAPPGGEAFNVGAGPVAVSPDGRGVAFVGRGQLWIHGFDQLAPRAVGRGGGRGQALVWSPDGRTLAFNAGMTLRSIDTDGESQRTLCDLPTPFVRGGAWNQEGTIVVGSAGGGLLRCAPTGGAATRLTQLDPTKRDSAHFGPSFLPDGRRLLYWTQPSREIRLTSLDGGGSRTLLVADSAGRYVEPGYLVFAREGTLFAQPFDAAAGVLSGEPQPIVEQVLNDESQLLGAAFDVSPGGVLTYRSGLARAASQLTWVDRKGQVLRKIEPPGFYANPNLSPDGKQIAVERTDPGGNNRDVFVLDVERDVLSRFTFDEGSDSHPVWSPDGGWIAFASDRSGVSNIYRKRANGAGTDELVLETEPIVPIDWSPDGQSIVYQQQAAPVGLGILTLTGTPSARLISPERAQVLDSWGQVSPDGRWLAYASSEAGPYQVFVQSFPVPDRGKWQVSGNGGTYPRWSRNGRELFFQTGRTLMSVTTTGTTTLDLGAAEDLFEPSILFGGQPGAGREQQYAVAPDGQRFLINVATGQGSISPITVVLNWQSLLKR